MLLPRPEMRTTTDMVSRPDPSRGRPRHRGRLDPAVEIRAGYIAERERRFAKRAAVVVRFLRYLRGAVVADVRRERGDQHERALQELADARLVRLDAARTMLLERAAAVGKQPRALQERIDDERLVDIQLEVSGGGADVHGYVVSEHACAQHGERLRLRRIHLARH